VNLNTEVDEVGVDQDAIGGSQRGVVLEEKVRRGLHGHVSSNVSTQGGTGDVVAHVELRNAHVELRNMHETIFDWGADASVLLLCAHMPNRREMLKKGDWMDTYLIHMTHNLPIKLYALDVFVFLLFLAHEKWSTI
jgi:hypothetical protein